MADYLNIPGWYKHCGSARMTVKQHNPKPGAPVVNRRHSQGPSPETTSSLTVNGSPAEDMQCFFENELIELYTVETILRDSVKLISNYISSGDLEHELKNYIAASKDQIHRLSLLFKELGCTIHHNEDPVISEFIKNATAKIMRSAKGITANAYIICTIKKAMHFLMASYESASFHADIFGESNAAKVLSLNYESVRLADIHLQHVAYQAVNADTLLDENAFGINERAYSFF